MRAAIAVLLLFAWAIPARAAELTLDTVFTKEPPWGRMIDRVSWSPDGKRFLYVRQSQDPDEPLALMLYDVAGGTPVVWLKANALGVKPPTPEVAGWSFDGARVALLAGGGLYVARLDDARPQKIDDDVDDAIWSPRSNAIAFAHNADLYVATLRAHPIIARITHGGVPNDLLNGTLDWVYPEELGIEHGFRWSPDGKRIAYLAMDQRRVTNFPIVDFLTVNNVVESSRYPLAGEPNPGVALHVVDVGSGADRVVYDAARRDEYIANFDWTGPAGALTAEILDRPQRSMWVDLWPSDGTAAVTAYRQTSRTWVDVQPLPHWLPDGRSIWLLDRGPTAGMFLRSRDGTLRKLTGSYRVTDFYGVARDGTIYIRAAYPTRRDRSLLAISLGPSTSSGQGVHNLAPSPGWHDGAFAPNFAHFVDTYSRLNDPPQAELVTTASGAGTTLAPENAALKAELLAVRMLEVPSGYGPLDATMLEPPGFDPSKRYPVVIYVYGGPDAPTTADSFPGLYGQLLAREGIIVFSIDGPASQVDSDAHVRLLFHNFGPGSLLGQEIGERYLATLPYVDPARIGIWGWSFGGYLTCYAMTHSRLFKAGAAVAPVTDWHFYDTIYTERYMGLPKDNPASYARSSVLNAAGSLNGPLLIQHGTSDNNVHMANTMQLIQRFILAHESRVLFYPYPRKTHSISGLPQRRSVYAHMLNFWKNML